jgi:hypothetical protein
MVKILIIRNKYKNKLLMIIWSGKKYKRLMKMMKKIEKKMEIKINKKNNKNSKSNNNNFNKKIIIMK